MKKILYMGIIALIMMSGATLNAQVGINTENPTPHTVLDVKNRVVSGDTVPEGILIPRMREAQRNAIDVSNVDDAQSLWVYNTDEDCFNYYSKADLEWKSVCGALGKAQFTFDCASVEVRGKYGDGTALDNSNYLRVTLNVTKPGSYSINAVSTPDNGYFFETTGNFFSPGPVTLNIPGTGQPVNHSQGTDLLNPADDTPDHFVLSSSGGGTDCNFNITVLSTEVRPNFTIDCGATVVEGMYFEDVALSSTPNPTNGQSNRIKVTLKNIPSTSFGAIAVLKTNEVDGMSFSAEAVLNSATQDIYLVGTGTPRGLTDKVMTITGNSESDQTSCTATVYMLIPRKRLLSIGDTDNTYNYNAAMVDGRNPHNSLNAMLTDKDNFGYNQWSILRFQGFNNRGTGSSNMVSGINSWTDDNRDIIGLNTAEWGGINVTKLTELLKGTAGKPKVDIVFICYNTAYFGTWTNADQKARCQALIDFMKTGGIVMIFSEQTASNGNFMRLMFGDPTPAITSAGGAGAGSNYTLGFNTSNADVNVKPYYCKDTDPILTGPFDDIVGRNWGEDASTTMYLTNIPLDSVVIYSGARPIGSTSQPAAGITIFRHKTYPFLFVGDGGFNSAEARTYRDVGTSVCPFDLVVKTINGRTYNSYPDYRMNFGGTGNRVYNAVFTANAFAWCIMQAEDYRRKNK